MVTSGRARDAVLGSEVGVEILDLEVRKTKGGSYVCIKSSTL